MPHGNLSAKERKKAQAKKNRFHQEIFNFIRLRRSEEERVQELEETRKPKREEKWAGKEANDKVATIRNRLTGQKRESKERWNRFAGTSGGGGRGL
jgi:hypothetical protein